MAVKRKNRCSFCGRTEDEVALMLSGLNGFICNDCVDMCSMIVGEDKYYHEKEFMEEDMEKHGYRVSETRRARAKQRRLRLSSCTPEEKEHWNRVARNLQENKQNQ